MAFVDTFEGANFINVNQRIGKIGAFDDLLFVQITLKFLFTEHPSLRRVNPVKGQISVTGMPAPDTPLLIAAFLKHEMKRAKPEGFVNRASGNDTAKRRFTIVQMNLRIELILAAQLSNIKDILGLIAASSPFASPFITEVKHHEIPRGR